MLISGYSKAQTMEFEEYDPPSTLNVPENPIQRAKYPFIDVHSHQWNMPEMDLGELTTEMDNMNMAVMINLSGRGRGSDEHLHKALRNVKGNYPNRFIIFTNVDFSNIDQPGWAENTRIQLEKDVEAGVRGLKIYKNLGMYNTDSNGDRISIDDPRIDPVWAKCGELGIPVLIHAADPKPFWDEYDKNNERWLELKLRPRRKRSDTNPAPWEVIIKEQHNVFRKHPGTTFINAHFGWYANDLGKLGELMEEFPNMYVEFGAVIAELGRQPRNAKRFFTKYQNRILFGKDSYRPEEYNTYFRVLETDDEYFPYHKRYHAFWRMYGMDLDDEILKKIYYKNALKVIPGIDASQFPE
ncbi:amidohydrolase family protein [Bacteroidota bacterium]